jgi:hypothetical protein
MNTLVSAMRRPQRQVVGRLGRQLSQVSEHPGVRLVRQDASCELGTRHPPGPAFGRDQSGHGPTTHGDRHRLPSLDPLQDLAHVIAQLS